MSEGQRQTVSVRKRVGCLALLLASVLVPCLPFAGCLHYLHTPRVMVGDVERSIADALPVGNSRRDVEEWLSTRGMTGNYHSSGSEEGAFIQSWIVNSGPPIEDLFVRDIRIRFYFDNDDRLVRFSVREEDRF